MGLHGIRYEKGSRREAVPYEVVRPSVTLITRYSVIANGRLRCALAARTTRLLTAALPASSPRSKLVAPSQPFGSRSVVPSSSRTRPTTRRALFCARMGGGFCSDGCGDGRETVMTTARNMGELAGFAIPRLGMGTMALAIEGRPDDIWTPPGRITCQANPAPAPPKTWATAKKWCATRSPAGTVRATKC